MSPQAHIHETTNDAGETTSLSINETLAQRGTRYGAFQLNADLSQKLQYQIFSHLQQRQVSIPPYILESLTLICHKLARIANGDPFYDDSWKDIAGYSQLVVDILHGKNP